MILDDYGAEKGVRDAVYDFVFIKKKGRILKFIGEKPGWGFDDRIIEEYWEGVTICAK